MQKQKSSIHGYNIGKKSLNHIHRAMPMQNLSYKMDYKYLLVEIGLISKILHNSIAPLYLIATGLALTATIPAVCT